MARLKSELSAKNEDRISKHRFYELQHHCRQYAEWKRLAFDLLEKSPDYMAEKLGVTNNISDPVAFAAEKREFYLTKTDRIKRLCQVAGEDAAGYLLISLTRGDTYDAMQAQFGVLPCSRVEFYKRYRRFFKLLDMEL